MKFRVCLIVAILAIAAPAKALLGAKLALLGALKSGIGGYGNGGGYGYGGGYGSGYDNGIHSNYVNYNRPVYTGQSANYGWNQQSYGGGYSIGYSGGYNDKEESVKVIKVIINREQPYFNNYARSSIAALSPPAANWSPIQASSPVVQTYNSQSVQSVPILAATPVEIPAQAQASSSVSVPIQGQDAAPCPAPIQSIQPPPRPLYVQSQPQPQYIQPLQPAYQQVTVQRPIQYPLQQTAYQQPQSLPQAQQTVKTIKLIVDGELQRTPAQTYGPPPPATTYVAPSVDNADFWNSNTHSIGTGTWKKGGIWESIGC